MYGTYSWKCTYLHWPHRYRGNHGGETASQSSGEIRSFVEQLIFDNLLRCGPLASDRFTACQSLLTVDGASDGNPWRRHVALDDSMFRAQSVTGISTRSTPGLDWRHRKSRTRPIRVHQSIRHTKYRHHRCRFVISQSL